MKSNSIKITENQLKSIISETIQKIIIEEGFIDNMGAAWQGAKNGYNSQQLLDRGTEGFKRIHDHEDAMASMDPLTHPENTAEEQSQAIYKQYQFHQAKANQLLTLYRKLNKEYDLSKEHVGKYVDNNKPEMGNGINRKENGILPNAKTYNMPTVNGAFGANQ